MEVKFEDVVNEYETRCSELNRALVFAKREIKALRNIKADLKVKIDQLESSNSIKKGA
jgi:hypothetical protein